MSTNLAALELMRHLGVCYRTAWRLKHKLMQAMTSREADRRLGGLVQIDDAYWGRERTGVKPATARSAPFCDRRGALWGRPSTTSGDTPVPGFTRIALSDWTVRHLRPDTDGLGAFRAVVDAGHAHTAIQGANDRAATESEGAQWVNIVQGNLKRALDGIYTRLSFLQVRQPLPGRGGVAI